MEELLQPTQQLLIQDQSKPENLHPQRRKHSPEFKDTVLAYARLNTVRAAAKQFNISESMIHLWKSKIKQQSRAQSADVVETLRLENERLKSESEAVSKNIDSLIHQYEDLKEQHKKLVFLGFTVFPALTVAAITITELVINFL